MSARLLVLVAVILSCTRVAHAQDGSVDRQTFRSGIEAVEFVINVMGRAGDAPRKLQREDFRLTENGVEQPLTTFAIDHPSATVARFTLGYSSSGARVVRKIEVKIRGIRRKIRRTLQPD
jgi:hypothetical protein